MNIERLEALLWARIDGTIDPQELAELEAHLAEHPKSTDIERQITVMAEELPQLERAQPPSELRERIDSALESAMRPIAHQAKSLLARPAPSWQARWLPFAASLLIGVAIGYLLHPGVNSSIDQSVVTGTMVTQPNHPQTGRVEIQLDGGAGSVVASRDRADVVVDVALTAAIDLGITLAGTGGPVQLESLSSTNASDTNVATHHGWVVIRTVGPGELTFSAVASEIDDPIRIQVSSGGFAVEERWIGPLRSEHEP
jgi:hypothetical protein